MVKEQRVKRDSGSGSGINEESVKNMLMGHAEACMQLADKLGGSEPLKEYERQLVRSAMLPAVKECMEIIQSNYMTGNVDWMKRETERLHDLLTFPR
jgi:hypothetical protein